MRHLACRACPQHLTNALLPPVTHQLAVALPPLCALLKGTLARQRQQLGLVGRVCGDQNGLPVMQREQQSKAVSGAQEWGTSTVTSALPKNGDQCLLQRMLTRLAVHALHGAGQRNSDLHSCGRLGGGILRKEAQVERELQGGGKATNAGFQHSNQQPCTRRSASKQRETTSCIMRSVASMACREARHGTRSKLL